MAKKKKYVPRPALNTIVTTPSVSLKNQELIDSLNQQLQALRFQLTEQEAHFAHERARLLPLANKPLDEQLEVRFKELALLTRQLEIRESELDSIRQKLDASQERHSRIKKTVSWKVTRPLRWIAKRLNFIEKRKPLTEQERQILTSGFFDAQWYIGQYLNGTQRRQDPLQHYLETGYQQGCNPSPRFDSRWYLEQNPDVKAAGINPLLHYLHHGQHEQRRPHP